jgi:hypothetical protein
LRALFASEARRSIHPNVATLIKEVEATAVASGDAAEQSRKRALDPALAPAEVAVARREMEDAAFRRDRLYTAVKSLGDRLNELRGSKRLDSKNGRRHVRDHRRRR